MFDRVCNAIVKLSPHNVGATLPETREERTNRVRASAAELSLFALNGAFAGTPVGYATGTVTTVYGAGLALMGLAQGFLAFGGSAAVALKNFTMGVACIVGGVSAFSLVVGPAVNFSLAAFCGAGATAAATTPLPEERIVAA